MPSPTVSAAVTARLAGFATPVVEMNRAFEGTPDGSAYVQVQYPIGIETQRTIGAPGSNIFEEEGAVRFVIVGPVNEGIGPVMAIAESLRTLFRNHRNGAVRFYEPQPATFDDDSDKAGAFVASVAVAYDFDLIA